VTVDAEGVPPDLPPVIELTAYRVIQEALTNVIRHSGADRCHVALGYGASQLSIEVTNPAIGPRVPLADPAAAGHGLIGMRERVIMLDGKFSARPTASGGFAVIATMPLAEVPT
jgi:signal transduction histidine kinase